MKFVNKVDQFAVSNLGKSLNFVIGKINKKETPVFKVTIKHFVPNEIFSRLSKIFPIGFYSKVTLKFIPPFQNQNIDCSIPIINQEPWMTPERLGLSGQISLKFMNQVFEPFIVTHRTPLLDLKSRVAP